MRKKDHGWRSFAEARAFVRTLGLKNAEEWQKYTRSGNKPTDIPTDPRQAYKGEFINLGDWLGTGKINPRERKYRSFSQARAFVQTLRLRSVAEWEAYCKSDRKPDDIPTRPRQIYRSEFRGYGDWLGTGTVAPFLRQYRPFLEARAFVRTLGLKSSKEWGTYCKSGQKPDDIPVAVHRVYKGEFKGMGDWLGTGYIAGTLREYLSFEEARAFARRLELKNQQEWSIYCKSGEKPADIPADPRRVYKGEFINLGDWLGTGTIHPHDRQYRPFAEARVFARAMGLRNVKEWGICCKSGGKPDDIPADPKRVYRSDFRGYGDWLGTGTVAPRERKYRPFPEARAFVQTLGLKNGEEWSTYCKSGQKPDDIPVAPSHVYKREYISMGDWLGTGTVAASLREYRSFTQARAFIRTLRLKSGNGWKVYCLSGEKPPDIPADPRRVYRGEFKSMGDWLGTGYVARQFREYLPFEEARAFVHTLELKSRDEWRAYCASREKSDTVPADPASRYRSEFRGMKDWLGASYGTSRKRQFSPFGEARASVRTLGLKNGMEWQEYCASGKRPSTIPASPSYAYGAQFKGMGDWLGTGTLAPRGRSYRPFLEARKFVHTLGLRNNGDWRAYCKSGKRPVDIPVNPDRIYPSEFRGYGDWLGTGRDYNFLPFAEARTFAHTLQLRNHTEWRSYCASGNKPNNIPSAPNEAYRDEFKGWGDWLGTGYISNSKRSYLPFAQARAFVHTLELQNQNEWVAYCRSDTRPENIPTNPQRTYRSEFVGMGDWLGTGNVHSRDRQFCPFVEARAFVRELGFRNHKEWQAYCASGEKPADIPSTPHQVYEEEFRGYGDWLGFVGKWSRSALLVLLHDLRPYLDQLEERELYVILQQGGVFPSLRIAMGMASSTRILRDLKENNGNSVESSLNNRSDEDIINTSVVDDDILEEDGLPLLDSSDILESKYHQTTPANLSDIQLKSEGTQTPLLLTTKESLHVVDQLPKLTCGLDDDAAEYLISNRVSALWERYISEGRAVTEELMSEEGGYRFTEIKNRFLSELEGVESLIIPSGWSFTDVNGTPALPNAMQCRTAWAVREKRRVGNWSGVGAGKTLSAILASRVIDSHVTLILTNNATVKGWRGQIMNAYPDSVVPETVDDHLRLNGCRYNYVIFNYEKFQGAQRNHLVHLLLQLDLDFIVFDEVQFVKQRDGQASRRRQALEALACGAAERNPNLRVLGMSATPVINNMLEAKKLLELITGLQFPDLITFPTVNNALAMHRALMIHGSRYRPRYEQEMRREVVLTSQNKLSYKLLGKQKSILQIEQVLLPSKLEAIRPYLQKGTIVYADYVDEIIAPIRRYIEGIGLRAGLYTGKDKSGLAPFLTGAVDVLVGTRPVGTGLDGLQRVCNRIIMLCLPWTGAEYEQIIGRIRRQGSSFQEVEIIIPQVSLEYAGNTWSWDQRRLECIEHKLTLSDCVLDGHIPAMLQINKQALLQQSREALERWIERIGTKGLLTLERPRLTVPLPPDIRYRAQVRHGDFSVLNQRWNISRSSTTHERMQQDPSEWYLYHTLYREAREKWPEQPFERMAERIRVRPDWVVGDFGCGECLLRQALPDNRVVGIDHVAQDEQVIACDMASTPLEQATLDVAVFSLSLMGSNWTDYLREAFRTLRPYGHLFIAEPQKRWQDRMEELKNAVRAEGFHLLGDVEQRYDFLYLTAIKI